MNIAFFNIEAAVCVPSRALDPARTVCNLLLSVSHIGILLQFQVVMKDSCLFQGRRHIQSNLSPLHLPPLNYLSLPFEQVKGWCYHFLRHNREVTIVYCFLVTINSFGCIAVVVGVW